MEDIEYLYKTLDLARKGLGYTSPNPMVGAIIVQDGKKVAEGWHKKTGTPHAEINALAEAGDLAKGSTMYVSLEPCNHFGRTGPCTEAIIQAGIKKVVVAMNDPNRKVSGKGIARLKEAGVEVVTNCLPEPAAKLNEVFIKWITTGMPFGVIKTAMTLDGKIACHTGHSKWITGNLARTTAHKMRHQYDAILAGIGTVIADDPELTCRLYSGKNPIRVIVDSTARIPLTAKVITDGLSPTIIAVSEQAPEERIAKLKSLGNNVEILKTPCDESGAVDLRHLFKALASRNITSVMIEGGSEINASALKANVVDKIYAFVAPKIIGGRSAPGPVGGNGAERMDDAVHLEDIKFENVGEDILISAYLREREGRDVYRTC